LKFVNEQDVLAHKEALKSTLEDLYSKTNLKDVEERKRTTNYYEWLNKKTKIIINEKDYIYDEKAKNIKRGSVVWVEFGFNIGNEFGGRHPAIVLRKTGNSIFVLPLSSQKPEDIKPYHVKIEKVYNFKNIVRWANVLKIQNVSLLRVDFSASIGNIKGEILDEINKAIEKSHIF
jgi:uncharacterized protein YifN (PemK superfamily)